MDLLMYAILGAATAIKIALYLYCVALQHKSDSILALAEDHRNDILSNATAIACGIGASQSRKVWWIDPVGAILISFYIIWSWALICKSQVWPPTSPTKPTDACDCAGIQQVPHALTCTMLACSRAEAAPADVVI